MLKKEAFIPVYRSGKFLRYRCSYWYYSFWLTWLVFPQAYPIAGGHKNPKVLAEALSWMAVAVEEFGLADIGPGLKVGHMLL